MNPKLNSFVNYLLGSENENWKDTGLLILRLATGIFMLTHGWQKISGFDTLKLTFPDPLGIGSSWSLALIIAAEAGCSLLIILGLFTRLAVFPLMFGMIVAAFIIHGNDPFAVKELSLLYLCAYIVLFFTGAGRFSLDNYIREWWKWKFPFTR